MAPQENRRSSSWIAIVAVVIVVGSAAVALMYQFSQKEKEPANTAGFDLAQVRDNRGAPSTEPPPQAQPAAPQDSLSLFANRHEGLGLGAAPAGQSGAKQLPADERAREKEFLARHDSELLEYQKKLNQIGAAYYKKYPIVREIDAEFAKMDRYMAIKRRYEADRDAYQWARDTVALPEVHDAIKKFLGRQEAWGAGVDIALAALKNPPPASIYKEVQRVMVSDPVMSDFTAKVAEDVKPNLAVGIPALAGKDLQPIQQVMSDISVNK
jgi:hypothetical protein